nr:9077_t:CDS:2 [Entrophospora candida]
MRKPKDSFSRNLIRMSWSKKNLYIISTRANRLPRLQNRTLFQQRWQAKKDTRAYHGAQLNERQFHRMFDPLLPTTIHIANNDVNNQKKSIFNLLKNKSTDETSKIIPTSVLAYATLERRLDFIVFRSCFAPSIWSARQMVRHGKVFVDGKKVNAPSYLAKDGEVISVKPSAITFLLDPSPSKPSKPLEKSKPSEKSQASSESSSTSSSPTPSPTSSTSSSPTPSTPSESPSTSSSPTSSTSSSPTPSASSEPPPTSSSPTSSASSELPPTSSSPTSSTSSSPTSSTSSKSSSMSSPPTSSTFASSLSSSSSKEGLLFKPIPYMQPFLFIPEYLEVNFNTCSTIFLRDPILRPNRTEIPSPFPPELHSLAHEFYTMRIGNKKDGKLFIRYLYP